MPLHPFGIDLLGTKSKIARLFLALPPDVKRGFARRHLAFKLLGYALQS